MYIFNRNFNLHIMQMKFYLFWTIFLLVLSSVAMYAAYKIGQKNHTIKIVKR